MSTGVITVGANVLKCKYPGTGGRRGRGVLGLVLADNNKGSITIFVPRVAAGADTVSSVSWNPLVSWSPHHHYQARMSLMLVACMMKVASSSSLARQWVGLVAMQGQ